MSGSERDLALGRPAGEGVLETAAEERARRETRVIYIGLAIVGLFALIFVFFLTRGSVTHNSGVVSDTKYDFAYRDPYTVIHNTNRIIVDADVFVTVTPHDDRPDTVVIDTTNAAKGSNASFTWTLTPQLGTDGPTQLAGEFYYQGTLYRVCEAIIGSPSNFPPTLNRIYAEQYYVLDNTGKRYRTPHQVDPTPFANFMRTTIAETYPFKGDGSLPSHDIRQMAGDLIQYCTAS